LQETTCFPYDRKFIPTWETVQFKVAAVNSNGTEGAHSNVVSITFTGGSTQPQPNTSINGTWESGLGSRVTVSGNTGVLSSLTSSDALWNDAKNKGYISIGSQVWRNIESKGNLTWSGQLLIVQFYTSSPNVAVSTTTTSCTFTMSADGRTLTIRYTSSGGSAITQTWTRR